MRFWLFWTSKGEMTVLKRKAGASYRTPNVVFYKTKYSRGYGGKSRKSWGQFEFRFTGKGPNISLKNRTKSASEIIAIHHGLNIIGNKKTSSHTHQGARDHRLLA